MKRGVVGAGSSHHDSLSKKNSKKKKKKARLTTSIDENPIYNLVAFDEFIEEMLEQNKPRVKDKCCVTFEVAKVLTDEIRKKVDRLESNLNFVEIYLPEREDSNPYGLYGILELFPYPRVGNTFCGRGWGQRDLAVDLKYLLLLKRLAESEEVKRHIFGLGGTEVSENLDSIETRDLHLPANDFRSCLQDYRQIYLPEVRVEEARELHDYLFCDPCSESAYLKGARVFKKGLERRFPHLGLTRDRLVDAVVKWWSTKREEDKVAAEKVGEWALEKAKEWGPVRMCTRGQYIKLKVDIARISGIIINMPDEIARFRLPGQYEWPDEV